MRACDLALSVHAEQARRRPWGAQNLGIDVGAFTIAVLLFRSDWAVTPWTIAHTYRTSQLVRSCCHEPGAGRRPAAPAGAASVALKRVPCRAGRSSWPGWSGRSSWASCRWSWATARSSGWRSCAPLHAWWALSLHAQAVQSSKVGSAACSCSRGACSVKVPSCGASVSWWVLGGSAAMAGGRTVGGHAQTMRRAAGASWGEPMAHQAPAPCHWTGGTHAPSSEGPAGVQRPRTGAGAAGARGRHRPIQSPSPTRSHAAAIASAPHRRCWWRAAESRWSRRWMRQSLTRRRSWSAACCWCPCPSTGAPQTCPCRPWTRCRQTTSGEACLAGTAMHRAICTACSRGGVQGGAVHGRGFCKLPMPLWAQLQPTRGELCAPSGRPAW